jgi:Glycosyltransferase family 87
MYAHLSLSSLFYKMGYPVALAALPLLFSRTRRSRLEKALFVSAAFVLVARSAWLLTQDFLSWDLARVHHAARNALNGASPYEVQTFLYLPTSLPIFELFGLVPFATMQRIWLIANTLMLLTLPYVSWVVLKRSGPDSEERIGSFPYAASACILVAVASLWGIEAGQMHLITSLLILAALDLKSRGRPFLAGLSLAAATLKIGMMLPALTQFCDRRGR